MGTWAKTVSGEAGSWTVKLLDDDGSPQSSNVVSCNNDLTASVATVRRDDIADRARELETKWLNMTKQHPVILSLLLRRNAAFIMIVCRHGLHCCCYQLSPLQERYH